MKETEILKIDSRGRIVIPRSMRKGLGLKENSHIMLISNPEENELRIIPLPFSEENQTFIKIRIIIQDEPGALGQVAKVFGDLNLSLLYGQEVVIKKGQEAEWNVISPFPNISLEDFKKMIIEKGGAKKVTIELPMKS
ncbi:MAG: AbrB/MazE/SpoVT family DNA-binding domain-containing protein [Candidatus Lokiarchaeota archaeon]|nr:AbrB/MazE/SpoVT family DNA-binding domain-containing protein [Candidatus Harpocratesius repetitus]